MNTIHSYLSGVYILFLYAFIFWSVIFIIFSVAKVFLTSLKKIQLFTLVYCFLINLGFSFMGLSIGILTGWSSSPVVGVVIPALLTFYGGMVSYAFLFKSKKSNKLNGIILSGSLISISFFLIVGAEFGTSVRIKEERKNKEIEIQDRFNYETFKYNLENSHIIIKEETDPKEVNDNRLEESKD